MMMRGMQTMRRYAMKTQMASKLYGSSAATNLRISEAEWNKRVEPPLYFGSKTGEFAQDLFVYATMKGALKEVLADVKILMEASRSVEDFMSFFEETSVGAESKASVLSEFLAKNGASPYSQFYFNELALLGEAHRVASVAGLFMELAEQVTQEVSIEVIMAESHAERDVKALAERLKAQYLREGDTVKVSSRVDPSLLDGYIAKFNGMEVDYSLKGQLASILTDVEGLMDKHFAEQSK